MILLSLEMFQTNLSKNLYSHRYHVFFRFWYKKCHLTLPIFCNTLLANVINLKTRPTSWWSRLTSVTWPVCWTWHTGSVKHIWANWLKCCSDTFSLLQLGKKKKNAWKYCLIPLRGEGLTKPNHYKSFRKQVSFKKTCSSHYL